MDVVDLFVFKQQFVIFTASNSVSFDFFFLVMYFPLRCCQESSNLFCIPNIRFLIEADNQCVFFCDVYTWSNRWKTVGGMWYKQKAQPTTNKSKCTSSEKLTKKKKQRRHTEIDKIAFSIVLHMITCLLNVNLVCYVRKNTTHRSIDKIMCPGMETAYHFCWWPIPLHSNLFAFSKTYLT